MLEAEELGLLAGSVGKSKEIAAISHETRH
jgi:hypothetical protein